MPSRDLTYVLDILNAARLAQSFVAGVDQAVFRQDLMRQSAVLRQLEVMGEAAKQVSPSFRAAYPHIPWTNGRNARHFNPCLQSSGLRDCLDSDPGVNSTSHPTT